MTQYKETQHFYFQHNAEERNDIIDIQNNDNIKTVSIMTLSIIMLRKMTLSIMKQRNNIKIKVTKYPASF